MVINITNNLFNSLNTLPKNEILQCKSWCLTEISNHQLIAHLDNLGILWTGLFLQLLLLFVIYLRYKKITTLDDDKFSTFIIVYVLTNLIFPIAYIITMLFFTLQ